MLYAKVIREGNSGATEFEKDFNEFFDLDIQENPKKIHHLKLTTEKVDGIDYLTALIIYEKD